MLLVDNSVVAALGYLSYIQPHPVTHWIAQNIRVSLLQVSAVCMVGSLIRSEVLPRTEQQLLVLQLNRICSQQVTYEYKGSTC